MQKTQETKGKSFVYESKGKKSHQGGMKVTAEKTVLHFKYLPV